MAFGLTLQFGSSKEKVSEQFAKHLFEYPLPAETSLIAKHQYNGKNFLDGAGNGGYWNVVAIVELSSQLSKDKILKFYQGIALFPYPKGERRGVELEIYFEDDKLKNKLNYANKMGIPNVILLGEDEEINKTINIKNMDTGNQEIIDLEDII